MNYNVIGPDGATYGPVDEDTLKKWVTEARILPTTMIEEVGSGQRVEAKTMATLFPPTQAPSQPAASVFHSGYEPPKGTTTGIGQVAADPTTAAAAFNRVSPTAGYSSATSRAPIDNHLIKAIICLILCLPLGIVAVVFASQVSAKQASGDRIAAQESADKANLFANIGLWFWGICTFLGIAAFVALSFFVFKH